MILVGYYRARRNLPIGADTDTKVAVLRTLCVPGTKQPNKIPRTMARNIHKARKRSRNESLLIIDLSSSWDIVAGPGSSEIDLSSGNVLVEWACIFKDVASPRSGSSLQYQSANRVFGKGVTGTI